LSLVIPFIVAYAASPASAANPSTTNVPADTSIPEWLWWVIGAGCLAGVVLIFIIVRSTGRGGGGRHSHGYTPPGGYVDGGGCGSGGSDGGSGGDGGGASCGSSSSGG